MKLLIYFVVFVILFNNLTASKVADSLIRKSCKKNAENAEPYYYKFCIASIKENPESQKVRNIDELTIVCTNNAISNITKVKGIVEKVLNEKKYKSMESEKMLRKCLKLYSDGYQFLTSALKYLKARNYDKAGGDLNEARTAPRTCEMGFNDDNKQISPVKKENTMLYDMIDIPLFFIYNAHTNNN